MDKRLAISLLCLAVICGMAPWFATAAGLADMAREAAIPPARLALLSSAVQAGFVLGALVFAVTNLPDRLDPRRVMFASAAFNAAATGALLLAPPGGDLAIGLRFLAGAGFAGVYPVGMKIAVGWGLRDRGLLVGVLVGALTLGSASPHLVAWAGGADWRLVVGAAALASLVSAGLTLTLRLGPHHAKAPAFNPRAARLIWTDRRIRAATGGYLGHMWELYALWGWVGAAAAAGYAARMGAAEAERLAALTAFLAIAAGGLICAPAGWIADRRGKAVVAAGAMTLSGSFALAAALAHGGPAWLSFVILVLWGATVVPDSAQFSAMIADAAPPEYAGSLMALQTALGFGLTIATVQLTPLAAAEFGWPATLALMALGPAAGVAALRPVLGKM